MTRITINVTGSEELKAKLEKAPVQAALAIRKLAQRVYDLAEQGADKHTKTGALFRSTFIKSEQGGKAWFIGHDAKIAPYAKFVHWGTKAHVIKPKNKKALRWVGNGGFVFAKGVKHPGYKGDPWLIKAKDQALKEFDNIVNQAMKGI